MSLKDTWDSYMVVNIETGQWEMVCGDLDACRQLERKRPTEFKVIPIRMRRRRWTKYERRSSY